MQHSFSLTLIQRNLKLKQTAKVLPATGGFLRQRSLQCLKELKLEFFKMVSHSEFNSTNLLLQFDINPIQDGSFCSFSQMEKRVLGKKKEPLPLKIILGNVIAISMISMKLEKHFWLVVIGHLLQVV